MGLGNTSNIQARRYRKCNQISYWTFAPNISRFLWLFYSCQSRVKFSAQEHSSFTLSCQHHEVSERPVQHSQSSMEWPASQYDKIVYERQRGRFRLRNFLMV